MSYVLQVLSSVPVQVVCPPLQDVEEQANHATPPGTSHLVHPPVTRSPVAPTGEATAHMANRPTVKPINNTVGEDVRIRNIVFPSLNVMVESCAICTTPNYGPRIMALTSFA